MNRSLALLPLLLLLPSIGCPRGELQPSRRDVRTLPLPAGGELRVMGYNGAIRVTTWDRPEVELEAEIREPDGGGIQLTTEARDGKVLVKADRHEADNRSWNLWGLVGGGVTFTMRVPKQAVAFLETSNGAISVRGLQGSLEARTRNGKVELQEHGGSAVLHTSNASVYATGVQGTLEVHTSNGSVTASDIQGKTTVKTSNAKISLTRIQGPAEVETSNGAIRAEALASDLQAETRNGRIELQDVLGRVDASTRNGAIAAAGLNGQGKGIRLATTNARISLVLGSLEGELLARTSRNDTVKILRKGEVQSTDDGSTRAVFGKPSQRIELTTTHGRITVE